MSASLLVRNVDSELVARFERRAARHGRSAEAEHREILRQALDHPACECVDLALARERRCRLVAADERLLRKIETSPVPGLRRHVRPLLPKLG